MLSRRRFLHSLGLGAAAGAALATSPFSLEAFEPSRHGQAGNAKTALGAARANAILLNSNENAYGPLPKTMAAMQQALGWANRYPDFDYDALVLAISDLHKIKPQLVHERGTVHSRLALRGLGADKYFSVLESDHVSRAAYPHKSPVQLAHPAIGNQPDENVAQFPQIRLFLFLQLQAILQGFHGELLEPGNID